MNSKNTYGISKLIAIVGPTASGKTDLAIRLAQKLGGEIICADSRTVYKYLDIGTAKPTQAEREMVPHWGLDIVGPEDGIFTVADFKKYAYDVMEDIWARAKLPILVGGSGLYVDAVLYDFDMAPPRPEIRRRLEALSIEQLQQEIESNNLTMPENKQNKRYLMRTLERRDETVHSRPLPKDWLAVGLQPPKEILYQRIAKRYEMMLQLGVIEEARRVKQLYGPAFLAVHTGIYKALQPYLESQISLDEVGRSVIRFDKQLAKRQLTWFHRHDNDIHWFENAIQAEAWIVGPEKVN